MNGGNIDDGIIEHYNTIILFILQFSGAVC